MLYLSPTTRILNETPACCSAASWCRNWVEPFWSLIRSTTEITCGQGCALPKPCSIYVSRSLYQFQVHSQASPCTGVYDQMEQPFTNRKFHFCYHRNFWVFFLKGRRPYFLLELSPPQRPLCVVGRLGRKKKRVRGARWEGERAPAVSLFPSSPACFLFFLLFYFDGDTQRGPLLRRELLEHNPGRIRFNDLTWKYHIDPITALHTSSYTIIYLPNINS